MDTTCSANGQRQTVPQHVRRTDRDRLSHMFGERTETDCPTTCSANGQRQTVPQHVRRTDRDRLSHNIFGERTETDCPTTCSANGQRQTAPLNYEMSTMWETKPRTTHQKTSQLLKDWNRSQGLNPESYMVIMKHSFI